MPGRGGGGSGDEDAGRAGGSGGVGAPRGRRAGGGGHAGEPRRKRAVGGEHAGAQRRGRAGGGEHAGAPDGAAPAATMGGASGQKSAPDPLHALGARGQPGGEKVRHSVRTRGRGREAVRSGRKVGARGGEDVGEPRLVFAGRRPQQEGAAGRLRRRGGGASGGRAVRARTGMAAAGTASCWTRCKAVRRRQGRMPGSAPRQQVAAAGVAGATDARST